MKAASAEDVAVIDFAFAIPGDLGLATGGYAYDRRVIAECRRAGCTVTSLALPAGFPFPTPAELALSAELLDALPAAQPVLVDGLALGALPAPMLRALDRPVAALVHHPLALETGIGDGQRAHLLASEREALAASSVVIATSPATARLLAREFAVPADRLVIAEPGTDPAPRARGTADRPAAPARLLAVGAVIPRKAYGVLVDALALLAARDWTCHIVGATDRDGEASRALQQRIVARGLAGRVTLTGAISSDALASEFDAADLFVSTSLFEGYGMGLAEALARGLPIIAARAGAVPDTVPPDAALLVPPNDATGFAHAISRLLDEPTRRRAMADAAWRHARTLPAWSRTAALITAAIAAIHATSGEASR